MKILVAIESTNPKYLAQRTLRWAGRAGFNMRVFIDSKDKLDEYKEAIKDANHDWYLDIPETVLVYDETPEQFAKREGFDLIVYLPDYLYKWNSKYNHAENPYQYAKDVGEARLYMGDKRDEEIYSFHNYCQMRRVI